MAQYYASEATHDPCEIRVVDYVEDEGAQSKHEMQKLLIGMAERAAAAVGKPTHKSGLPNWCAHWQCDAYTNQTDMLRNYLNILYQSIFAGFTRIG